MKTDDNMTRLAQIEEYVAKLREVIDEDFTNEAEVVAWSTLIECRAGEMRKELGR